MMKIKEKLFDVKKDCLKLVEIIDDVPSMICRFLPDCTLTFVNREYAEYFRMSESDLIGKSFLDFIKKEDAVKIKQLLLEFDKKNNIREYEHPVIVAGNVRWHRWIDKALFDDNGKITEFQSIGRDITEEIKTRDMLKNQELLNENILNAISDPISVIDTNMFILKTNRNCDKMWKESKPLTGKKCYSVFHNSSEVCDWCPAIETLNTGKINSTIIPIPDLSSVKKWIEIKTWPLEDKDKRITGAIVYAKDITDSKKFVNELIINKNQLERKVKERGFELENKNNAFREILSQLEMEKNEVKRQVLNNIEEFVLPIVRKIESEISENQKELIKLLNTNLKNVTDKFGSKLNNLTEQLTPRELEICNMIKNGLRSEEISKTIGISVKTVERHRFNIRKKIGIYEKGINLATYLIKEL
ncbi:PAS domain S-box protein [Candidatus Dependentiae bacterium]|nr:PAS domain S-box protein [Candidatus Dependentiae bacterium]